MEQRFVIKYLLQKQTEVKDIIAELLNVYGLDALSKTQVYYWVNEIKHRGKDLSDAHQPGRPVDEQLIVSIYDRVRDDPFISVRMLANEPNIDHKTVIHHLTQSLNMKYVNLKWFPHFLTQKQKLKRIELSRQILDVLEEEERTGFEFILTGDESWFVYFYQHDRMWVLDIDDREEGLEGTHHLK